MSAEDEEESEICVLKKKKMRLYTLEKRYGRAARVRHDEETHVFIKEKKNSTASQTYAYDWLMADEASPR